MRGCFLPVPIVALVLVVGLSPRSAQASATVTTFDVTCTSFTASGTSTSPLVTIFAANETTNEDYFVIVPVVAGSFTGTVNFPEAASGASFTLQVWGSLNTYTNIGDSGYWDNESFFSQEQTASCNVPALGYGSLALLMAILALAGGFALRRSAA